MVDFFECAFDENGNEKTLSSDWDGWRKFKGAGKRWIKKYILAEEIPNWGQYKYLNGYLGDLLVEAGEFYDTRDWINHIEKFWNYEDIKVIDRETREVVMERVPRSINMQTVSKKRLAELTELAKRLCDELHIVYDDFDSWIKTI